jgi:UDP-N-acetylglucosamine 2-epimerase (non-hydrolysing)
MATPLRVLHVVGARPNFMKAAPLVKRLAAMPEAFVQALVHTGQHYDAAMSDVFFRELDIPAPDVNLEVGSGTHAQQTAQIMLRFEPVLVEFRPDWVLVPGDVNSTLACALVAAKLGFPVAHVEAGLRSFDRRMPEEINRVLTDHLCALLLTPSADGNENLLNEGIDLGRIHLVGNIMIDTLVELLPKADLRWPGLRDTWGLDRSFVLVTLHRPSNVDDPDTLREVLLALNALAAGTRKIVFPVHPRTRRRIASLPSCSLHPNLALAEPLGYLDFLALEKRAALVLTDSGGIQEETTFLGVPCLTVRPNTERPVTITLGTNTLVASTSAEILAAACRKLDAPPTARRLPPLWDGNTAARIASLLHPDLIAGSLA